VKASANLYSVIETAKANKLEPYAYLRYLFTELPQAETVEAIEALLPGNIDKNQIKSVKQVRASLDAYQGMKRKTVGNQKERNSAGI